MTGVQRILEVGLILCGAFAVFLLLALASFNPADPSWSQTGYEGAIHNAAGAIGAWFADALLFALGFVAYLIPFGLAALGYLLFRQPHRLLELDYLAVGLRFVGLILTLVGASALASINFDSIYSFSAGGVIGDVISSSLLPYFNLLGTTLLLLTFLCTGLTLVTGMSWIALADGLGALKINGTLWLVHKVKGLLATSSTDEEATDDQSASKSSRRVKRLSGPKTADNDYLADDELNIPADERGRADEPDVDLDGLFGLNTGDSQTPSADLTDVKTPSIKTDDEPPRFSRAAKIKPGATEDEANGDEDDDAIALTNELGASTESAASATPMPSLELLDRPDRNKNPITEEELEQVSRAVEAVLQDFGVDAKVANVQPGPVVTRFELDLAAGVKVSKISNLDKDIARSLSVEKVHLV